MADKNLLSKALVALLEGNEAEAKKQFSKYINEAKVEIIAEKLTEKEEVEEEIPTDDKVAELKDEITVDEPADLDAEENVEELDLDDGSVEEISTEETVEDTTSVVPVEDAEEALANSGEEVGVEEDPDFLALVDEFNKALEDEAVEVPSEEVVSTEETVEEPVEDTEVSAEETLDDGSVEEVSAEEITDAPTEETPLEKQDEIDIEKFIK